MTRNAGPSAREVTIPMADLSLCGILHVPENPVGVVAFAHGSGSGRHSPRNQFVAQVLQRAGLATLLLDLLSERESLDRAFVFDIELLAERLQQAGAWLENQPATRTLPMGYFGASTGAAAALIAAARTPASIHAVVSRGGRPDLAIAYLSLVKAPTLLIVGGRDDFVIELNEQSLAQLNCTKHISIIPGATHLFEEPGALETVAEQARDWFLKYLGGLQTRRSQSP